MSLEAAESLLARQPLAQLTLEVSTALLPH